MKRSAIFFVWVFGSVIALLVAILPLSALPARVTVDWAVPALTTTPSPSATASPTPTVTATPEFSATLDVVPDRSSVQVGEMLEVTLSIDVAEGCQYPVFEVKLTQNGANAPNFIYIDPDTEVVGPPVTMPFTFHLLADTPGEVTLDGRLYGEKYCGDAWIWTYVSGSSPTVTILADTSPSLHLPFVIGAPAPELHRSRR